ncbi:MAG: aldehyde dehydrogenase [Lachnospiraceae bacterium]|nr:aldehyde dehydrogenase [Lachnospiraceae bacterium]
MEISEITELQRKFFKTGKTLDPAYRLAALEKLEKSVKAHEKEVTEALKLDLGKSEQEAFMCEYGLSLSELNHMKKHLKSYARRRRVKTPLTNVLAASYVYKMPYGNVLVMSPWNYPFLLTMEPLIDAIAAGNTVVLKPSAYSPNTSLAIKHIIEEAFEEAYVAVTLGGRAENQKLLDERFDLIFFTGSQRVGTEVMQKAAVHLTPVTLELGGKSPCIIDRDADIKLAAKRVVFGKYLNLGQTCIAPDYVLCHKEVKEEFVKAVKAEIEKQFPEPFSSGSGYGKIINEKHFDRLLGLIDKEKVVMGGKSDRDTLKIEPTVMDNVAYEDAVMQEEIFGPLMPILEFEDLNKVLEDIDDRPHPLAFYYFTNDLKKANKVISRCRFGGGCINDTIIHIATSYMPFGGVGASGMGNYHGKSGFDTFSHSKSIVDKKRILDVNMRYQPYDAFKLKLIKMFLK